MLMFVNDILKRGNVQIQPFKTICPFNGSVDGSQFIFCTFTGTASARINVGFRRGNEHVHLSVQLIDLQWLEHLWNHEKMFETGVVPSNEC